MLRSLQSGISGLQAHQMYLDVIGNNLANANTTGYKGSRMNFIDMFNQTLQHASSPSSSRGGTNPLQIGLGVRGGSIDPNMNQGALITTGRAFDIGIQGQGFFVLSDGDMNHYTRAGTFGLDGNNYLVDQATGMRVQSPTLTDIEIETQESVPPSATSEMQVAGNLPAEVTGPFAEVLTTNTPYQDGTEAINTGSGGPYAFTDGDSMTIRVNGGAAQTVTFNTADFANIGAATAAEVAAVINADVTGVTATDVGGAIQIMTDAKGENASIDIDEGTGMPATAMGLDLSQVNGSQIDASASTNLNRLVSNSIAYVTGDVINVSGKDGNGQIVDVNFIYGTTGTTLGELRAFIDTNFTGASCTIDSSGNLVLTASAYGEADLSLVIMDNEANTGSTSFSSFAVTTDGADPDEATTSISVFDSQGNPHTLSLRFERVYDPPGQPVRREWNLHIPHPNGTESVFQLQFNPDGSFAGTTGNTFTINFLNGTDPNQVIELDLGSVGEYDGLTMTGGQESVQVISQDGYAAGDLASMSIDMDGTIVGLYTNGQFQDLGNIGIAMFNNPAGLEKEGGSLLFTSPNSGMAVMGDPGSGGAGTLLAGTLEESNVDISEEFVNMIEAQRGFQANARVITTSDEVLAETVNLV